MEQSVGSGAIMFHPDLLQYDNPGLPPENGRLACIVDRLILDGLWAEAACQADIAPLKRLRDIHQEDYLTELHRKAGAGVEKLDERTPLMEKSFELARYGAGGVLDAVDLIMTEEISTAFVLTGMPGHHAGTKSFGGGCLINPVAAGAHYLTKKFRQQRVAIIDLDSAHGNGTQEIFFRRRDVLTLSLHEYPGFPGSGHYSEIGDNPAKGYNINIPVPSGYGDREYLAAFKEVVVPILEQYQPEFILLAFGTGAFVDDPLSHLLVSEGGFLSLLQETMKIARRHAHGRVISVLEGGTPGVMMGQIILHHVMLLLKNRLSSVDKGKKTELVSYSDWYRYSKYLKAELKKYWRI
jgi:acetoin utilization deacetylase AcuC-like enzyme